MLTRRLIVCLDVKGGRVVKGVNFESLRDMVGDFAGSPVEASSLAELLDRIETMQDRPDADKLALSADPERPASTAAR